MMVNVAVQGMTRRFRDGTSIGPIDLQVQDGEFMTLLGPSGSGKTTTLRMVAGFISPQSGRILFDQREVTHVSPRERNIGMVFQSVALFPNMNVYQNIAFGLEMANWSREATVERVEYLADLLGIRGLLHRKIREVSGGEGQRIALARALAKEPSLLLLDEPLSALDPQLRERLQTEIKRTQRELGVTTIYVTHSQDEAFAISDQVAILNEGRVWQVGYPEDLYDRPASEFVARFLGGGNILYGNVVDSSKDHILVESNEGHFWIQGTRPKGADVKFTVKPEDVSVSMTPQDGQGSAKVVSVVSQVGAFRVTMDIGGEPLVAIVTDESLGRALKSQVGASVHFNITPYRAIALDDGP
ncbi:MAG: ABC transporter ATP-binding protein [Candidatus Thorarchaeota archaeon]